MATSTGHGRVTTAEEVRAKAAELMAPVLGQESTDALARLVSSLHEVTDVNGTRPLLI